MNRKIRLSAKCKLVVLAVMTFCLCGFSGIFLKNAYAQDFYGEGNVLIAVDMGEYAENEDVYYPEGTMGKLVWGEDAPTGVSTRVIPKIKQYTVPDNITPMQAPEYEIETTYNVGDRIFFPYISVTDPDEMHYLVWIPQDAFPSTLFANGNRKFWFNEECIKKDKDGKIYYAAYLEYTDEGEPCPCLDFLEMECVKVTQYSTIWQYTGNAVSNRSGFDINDYGEAVSLTQEQMTHIGEICDKAYTVQAETVGDPRFADAYGDCDGKVAYIVFDFSKFVSKTLAYYSERNIDFFGLDCLCMGTGFMSLEEGDSLKLLDERISAIIAHELNHYIIGGCTGNEEGQWAMWTGEAFAQSAALSVFPEATLYFDDYLRTAMTGYASRLRMIFGSRWGSKYEAHYPIDNSMVYALGGFFFRYVERMTTGKVDSGFWTEYLLNQTPLGSIREKDIEEYLKDKTGIGLDEWLAQFMAAVVVGDDSGSLCAGAETITANNGIDLRTFLRPYEEYGINIGTFNGVMDEAVKKINEDLTAVRGGGTTYAYRNDAGGKIAITGADENWFFFAVNMELPDLDQMIEISSAEELAKIGRDDAYPLSGKYVLTKDIDLGGEKNPWQPIGREKLFFTGEFDGNGHTISGLYINNPAKDNLGLFGEISGTGVICNLTVKGSVTGNIVIGGIVGKNNYGSVENCTSRVNVSGEADVGGIVGHNNGMISGCNSLGSITGQYGIGGIAGLNENGTVYECTAEATVSGENLIGGIVGSCENGIIDDCSGDADVSGLEAVGGIVGFQLEGSINDCYVTFGKVTGNERTGGIAGGVQCADVTGCDASCTVTGNINTGGIAGWSNSGNITDCSVDGIINGTEYTGGMTGYNAGTYITDCVFGGDLTGEKVTGGITGYIRGYCVIYDCHYIGEIQGGEKTGHIAGKIIDVDIVGCSTNELGAHLIGSVSGESYLHGYLINSYSGEFLYKYDEAAKMLSKKTDSESLSVDSIKILDELYPITVIGKKALAGNKALVKVALSENVTAIGKYAFKGDTGLKTVELTSSITKIRKGAFKGISADAEFIITASKEDYKRIVSLLIKSGVDENANFIRKNP